MRDSDISIASKMQLYGVLSKRPFGHQSNKWAKRFFIIKDGFLLYYQDSEKKDIERRSHFNIHPKGCIPLGGCHVAPVSESGHPFAMHITSEEINGTVVIAADSQYEQEKWLDTLRQATRITWNNAQISDAVIQQQEIQGLQMAREKQDYFDQLQSEAMALQDERMKTEELEQIREELEKEKAKMEQHAFELREQYESTKSEMAEMHSLMKAVEDDKIKLDQTTKELQTNLEDLEKEKEKTLQQLKDQHNEALKLSQEKKEISQVSIDLQQNLKEIEKKTQLILEEKRTAEEKLLANESKAQQLEEEKQLISEHASELKDSIKELAAQKAVTEAELKEEVLARLDVEKRLKEAERSLQRLEKDVMEHGEDGRNADEVREEMIGDVKTLKKFFENLAFEAKLDHDKPLLIKNSIHARKSMVRRAKTMRYEMTRKKRSRARRGSYDNLQDIFEGREVKQSKTKAYY